MHDVSEAIPRKVWVKDVGQKLGKYKHDTMDVDVCNDVYIDYELKGSFDLGLLLARSVKRSSILGGLSQWHPLMYHVDRLPIEVRIDGHYAINEMTKMTVLMVSTM
jgi:hypothetical protein